MAITRYNPWRSLEDLHKEIDRMFHSHLYPQAGEDEAVAATDWTPAADIKEEEDKYVIHADIPGVKPEDIDVSMENGILTIKGERESEKKDNREGYKRVERVYGSFMRRFSLPDTADADRISAKSVNGVLEVVIPKQEKQLPKRIAVDS